jgi:hypothetical protein
MNINFYQHAIPLTSYLLLSLLIFYVLKWFRLIFSIQETDIVIANITSWRFHFFAKSAMTSLGNVEVAKGSLRTEGFFVLRLHNFFFSKDFFFWVLALQNSQEQTDSHTFSTQSPVSQCPSTLQNTWPTLGNYTWSYYRAFTFEIPTYTCLQLQLL